MVRASTDSSIPYDGKPKHKDDTSFTGVDLSLRDRSMAILSDKEQKKIEKEKFNDNKKKEDFKGYIGTSCDYGDESYYADIDASPVSANSIHRHNLPKISLLKNLRAESYSHKSSSFPDLNNDFDKNKKKFLIYDRMATELSTASPILLLPPFESKPMTETSNNHAGEIHSLSFNDDTVPYPDFRDDLNVLSANQAIDCLNSAEETQKKGNYFNDMIPTKQKVEDYLNSTGTQQRYANTGVYPRIQSLIPLSEFIDSRSTHKDILHLKPEEFETIKHVDSEMRNGFMFKKFNIMMVLLLAFNLIIQVLAILLYILNILPESIGFIQLFFFCLVLSFFIFVLNSCASREIKVDGKPVVIPYLSIYYHIFKSMVSRKYGEKYMFINDWYGENRNEFITSKLKTMESTSSGDSDNNRTEMG